MEEKKQKNSYVSRLLAVLALIGAVIVIVIAIGGATGGEDEKKKDKPNPTRQANKPKTNAKTYEVEEGDNLTTISQKTGISVQRLQKLNPELDPQALQLGQKLKLR